MIGIKDMLIYNQIIPMSWRIFLLYCVLLVQICSSELTLKVGHYREQTLQESWKEILQISSKAQKIIVQYSGLTEHSLIQILSLPFPNLKILTFGGFLSDSPQTLSIYQRHQRQYLTHRILKTIFTSTYIDSLIQINLVDTNIDDKYWDFVYQTDWKGRQFKLQRFYLGKNYIGKEGFKKIAYLPIRNVKQIDVSGNLLIDSEAVASIISIMSINQSSNKIALTSLDISETNIKIQDFTKLLTILQPSSLQYLGISGLNLHLNNKYKDGFNLTAYSALKQCAFTSLKKLEMNDMALDFQIVKLFAKWSLPQLESLSLFSNFIDGDSLKIWITKENFPKLKRLILFATDIGDDGIQYLIHSGLNLRELNIGMTHISRKGLTKINQLNFPSLQILYLKTLQISSQTLKSFFQSDHIPRLKQVSLKGNKYISDIFLYMPWERLVDLKALILTDCYLQQSFHSLLSQNKMLLPSLRYLMINGTGITEQQTIQFINKAKVMFPQLNYVNIMSSSQRPINLTQIENQKLGGDTLYDLGYFRFRKGQGKIQCEEMSQVSWFFLYSSKESLIKYLQPTAQYYLQTSEKSGMLEFPKDMIQTVVKEFQKMFIIERVQYLKISHSIELTLLLQWIKQANITQLSYLNKLQIVTQILLQDIITLLKTVKLPFLSSLKLHLNITKQTKNLQQFSSYIENMHSLVDLSLKFTYQTGLSRKKDYNNFLNLWRFPFLTHLDLRFCELQTQQLGGIIHNHSQTLRYLYLSANSIEKNMLKMLAEHKITLKSLDISFITFTIEQFMMLGQINLGFLKQLTANKCDLSDDHLISMVNTSKQASLFFIPKISILNFNDNNIRQAGIQTFFQQSLFHLVSIRLNNNYNPHILNIILTYSTKILQILTDKIEMYALSKDIQPISTRRIITVALFTASFNEEDYRILGNLDFKRLQILQVQTRNLYQCDSLRALLKISQNAKIIWFAFDGFNGNLKSNCLTQYNQSYNPIAYKGNAQMITILQANSDKTFIPELIGFLISTETYWKRLAFHRLRLPPSIFLSISPESLTYVKALYLQQNHINDEAFTHFLKSPLKQLQFLNIANTDITMKSIKLLNRQQLILQHLDLSGLPLGEQGVEFLIELKAPKLKFLILEGCEIKSLKRFEEMNFPQLYRLYISRNSITAKDLLKFLEKFDRKRWPKLWDLRTMSLIPTYQQWKKIKQISQQKKIQVTIDDPTYLRADNNALY